MSGVIIKAHDSQVRSRGLYSLDLRDVSKAAQSMLTAARAQAEQIVEIARNQAAQQRKAILDEARREGSQQGLAEGQAQGRQAALEEASARFAEEQTLLLATLTKALADFDARREELFAAARRDAVVLAIAIAARICRRLAGFEDVAASLAEQACGEALAMVGEAADVCIHVHPRDAAAIEALTPNLSAAIRSKRHIRVVEDSSIARGGVNVKTADTQIDAAVTTRIERIADELVTDWHRRQSALGLVSATGE